MEQHDDGNVAEGQSQKFAALAGMVATPWQLVGAGIASVLAYVNLPARIILPTV